MSISLKKLVVVPNDPLCAYEQAGYPDQTGYFNPEGFFDFVFCVSPWEKDGAYYRMYGMDVFSVDGASFPDLINQLHPDVIRFYDWRAYAIRSFLPGSAWLRPAIILSVHDSDVRRIPFPTPLNEALLPDVCISMSTIVDRMVNHAGVPASRVRRLYNRIDTSIFRPVSDWKRLSLHRALELAGVKPSKESMILPGLPWILVVGRMSEQKNQQTLLRAFLARRREYVCVFVGKGVSDISSSPYYDPRRMLLIESVSNELLPVLYNACDLFVLPTLWEGFGTVFIEAMSCAAVVLTSPIAPMTDYIEPRRTGLFFDRTPYHPETVATGIEEAFRFKESFSSRFDEIGREGSRYARKFSKQKVDRMEVNIYREVMAWHTKRGKILNSATSTLKSSSIVNS